jgi:ABC-2 type transport system permease protein
MTVLLGVARHEWAMQVRRLSLWIAMALLGLVFLTLKVNATQTAPVAGEAAVKLNYLAPMLIGILVADRLVRDSRLGVRELLEATGSGLGPRLWGKYLGTVAACLVPLLLLWLLTLARLAVSRHDPGLLPLGLAAFIVIQLPAALFVGAFALVCPTVIGSTVFRVLFIGYWLWGNLMSPTELPSPSGTWLSPLGDYARAGFFGGQNPIGAQVGAPAGSGAGAALASIGLLLALAAGALIVFQAATGRLRAMG